VEIVNVNHVVRDLKERGFTVYGLDSDAKRTVSDVAYDEPAVFILGSEATGIRTKTAELCDELVSIPMHPRAESLNVAASAAVVLHAWSSKHPEVLTG
jgi:23S rRNA (guanosine2251-2'-O)-methyltransferase